MDWTIAVIELLILFSYVVVYVHIWPIWKNKTKSRYKMLICLSTMVIIVMAILKAPTEAMKILGAVLIKDIIVYFFGCEE